jgi:hypothetical protein
MQTRGRLRLSIGMAGLVLVVIPGWRVCAGPGIQLPSLSLFLDSGFALSAPRNDSGAAFSLLLAQPKSDLSDFGPFNSGGMSGIGNKLRHSEPGFAAVRQRL